MPTDHVITLRGALPEGWRSRTLALPGDRDGVVAVVDAYDRRYGEQHLEPPEEVADELATLPDAGANDTLVALDPAGDLRGFVSVETFHADAGQLVVNVWVDPGVGADLEALLDGVLLDTGLAHATRWAHEWARDDVLATSGCLHADTALQRAFAAAGLTPWRSFYEMAIDHPVPSADAVGSDVDPTGAPPGVRVRTIGEAELELAYQLAQETFADHFNFNPRTFEDWRQRRLDSPGFDPTQIWVAELDGEPAGVCIGDASRADMGGGYVPTVGVRRAHRGHGIAKHLLRVAFREHVRRGWGWTALNVDADSPTGATDLYRGVGMRVTEQYDLYHRQVGRA